MGQNWASIATVIWAKIWLRSQRLFGRKFGSDNRGYLGQNVAHITTVIMDQNLGELTAFNVGQNLPEKKKTVMGEYLAEITAGIWV